MEMRSSSPGESALDRLLKAYVAAGLLFMLLPGTFLGVWNLLSISSERSLNTLSPSWIQAHGHAQIFGWIGTFIIGIGYYSLTKMGAIAPFAVRRGWISWGMWIGGVTLRWMASITLWNWRVLLPVSAVLELAAFLIFFRTVSSHKRSGSGRGMEAWMIVVIASTFGFLAMLLFNAGAAFDLALFGESPALPHLLDQRFLVVATWGVPVLAIWGFNTRWFRAFLGLRTPSSQGILLAAGLCAAGVVAAGSGNFRLGFALLTIASAAAAASLNVFERAERPPELMGVHRSFPGFVRACYLWLMIAAVLSLWAADSDRNGGIWGASRHALTVGFLAAMIFTIGPRILPVFCGGRRLYSPRLMLASCTLLNLGCLMRVSAEIPAYEWSLPVAWHVLPCSAVVEMIAVSLFALNLALTLLRPAATVQDSRLYSISFKTSTEVDAAR